jgi:predicted small metal-binding protein
VAKKMYEFVCDRIIPGCTHTETAATKEEAREKAEEHLREHHGQDVVDDQSIAIDLALLEVYR